MGTPLSDVIELRRRRAPGGSLAVGRSVGCGQPVHPGGPRRRRRSATRPWKPSARGWEPPGSWCSTTPSTSSPWPRVSPASWRSSRAGSAHRANRTDLATADLLDRLRRSTPTTRWSTSSPVELSTVADGARCFLAHQQERVVGSLLNLFPEAVQAHWARPRPSTSSRPLVPVVIAPAGVHRRRAGPTIDERHARQAAGLDLRHASTRARRRPSVSASKKDDGSRRLRWRRPPEARR